MRKSILVMVLSLVLLLTFGINVQAQSKEVTEFITTTYYAKAQILPLGEGRFYMQYDAPGLSLTDTGEGLFHSAMVRALGGMTVEKGVYKDERGWGVFNLQNGDKVFFKYTYAGELNPKGVGVAKGVGTLAGGTGKAAGIQGSFEFTRYTPRSSVALEGVGPSYTKGTVRYTLP